MSTTPTPPVTDEELKKRLIELKKSVDELTKMLSEVKKKIEETSQSLGVAKRGAT